MILSIAKAPKTLQQREARTACTEQWSQAAVSSAELGCALGHTSQTQQGPAESSPGQVRLTHL